VTGQPGDYSTTGQSDTTGVQTEAPPTTEAPTSEAPTSVAPTEQEECTEQTCKDGSKVTCSLVEDDCECEACPTTKEVKFKFRATITADQFNTHKAIMTEEIADLLNVHKDNVKLALRTAEKRRNLNEGIDIEVTVQTEDEAAATEVEKMVEEEKFKADLTDTLSGITGSAVTVMDISEPIIEDIPTSGKETTAAPAEEDKKSNTVIIVVVVLVVLVCLIGVGFAYYQYNSGGNYDHKGGVQLAGNNEEFQFA